MSVPLAELTGDYVLDPTHTRIGFVARHAMVTKVRGAFHEFEGTAHLDGADPAGSTGQVVIKAESIDTGVEQRDQHLRTNDFLDAPNFPDITFRTTGVEQRDQHLRTNDFLDAPNFPDITFRTTGVEQKSDTEYRVTGDLTIKDTTKPVAIDFEYTGNAVDPYGNLRVGLEGSVTVSRKEFGITWNAALEGGGVLVGDKIVLEFDVSAIKQG
ncbi:YceI family protein [Streptomyces sp. NPDC057217]|uniref:YceI family protein n=1 Tax=Streptomyces sp. NPDC057217 TaxID=3346054 RepID=UPI00362DA25B